jgi:hypothetical protein
MYNKIRFNNEITATFAGDHNTDVSNGDARQAANERLYNYSTSYDSLGRVELIVSFLEHLEVNNSSDTIAEFFGTFYNFHPTTYTQFIDLLEAKGINDVSTTVDNWIDN